MIKHPPPIKQRKRIKPKKANPSVIDKLEEELDTAWRCAIRAKYDFKCSMCNEREGLHAHHIISRKCKSTRWNLDNGLLLCAKHHNAHHHNAQTQYDMKQTKLYKELKRLSNITAHFTEEDLIKKLAELTNENTDGRGSN
jgi:predicted restriction endonuclease